MENNEILKLSKEIKLQRFKKQISQKDCASFLKVSVPTYREFEYNPQKLNLEQAQKLSELLEWNLFEFFLNCILQNAIKNEIK